MDDNNVIWLQASVHSVEKDQICRGTVDKYSALSLVSQLRKNVRQATLPPTSKPRPSDDPFGKLISFNKLNGGGGGGGGATFVFRVSFHSSLLSVVSSS